MHREVFRFGQVEFVSENRISRGIFIDVRRAVTDPLPCNEYGHFAMKFEFYHLERRSVLVSLQVADKAAIFADFFGSLAVRNACGLHDGFVITHIVHEINESVIKALNRLVNPFFSSVADRPAG